MNLRNGAPAGSAHRDDSAVVTSEIRKRAQYASPNNETFNPRSYSLIVFAIEAFGRLGTSLYTSLDAFTERLCSSSGSAELYGNSCHKGFVLERLCLRQLQRCCV